MSGLGTRFGLRAQYLKNGNVRPYPIYDLKIGRNYKVTYNGDVKWFLGYKLSATTVPDDSRCHPPFPNTPNTQSLTQAQPPFTIFFYCPPWITAGPWSTKINSSYRN